MEDALKDTVILFLDRDDPHDFDEFMFSWGYQLKRYYDRQSFWSNGMRTIKVMH